MDVKFDSNLSDILGLDIDEAGFRSMYILHSLKIVFILANSPGPDEMSPFTQSTPLEISRIQRVK